MSEMAKEKMREVMRALAGDVAAQLGDRAEMLTKVEDNLDLLCDFLTACRTLENQFALALANAHRPLLESMNIQGREAFDLGVKIRDGKALHPAMEREILLEHARSLVRPMLLEAAMVAKSHNIGIEEYFDLVEQTAKSVAKFTEGECNCPSCTARREAEKAEQDASSSGSDRQDTAG